MPTRRLRAWIERNLADAGIVLDGRRPWDPRLHDERLFRRVLAQGSLGFGEAYMDGWWDCDRIDELVHRLLRADTDRHFHSISDVLGAAWARIANLQSPRRAGTVGRRHYDLGNDLFDAMLGPTRMYSCAYWKDASTLDEAQEAKLALVGEKLHLKPGMRVLDIGCGWGGAERFLAERYQVELVGVTVSKEQVRGARDLCRGLPVEIRYQDYREIDGTFDRVFSIGMFEHVGYRNYARFMDVARKHLRPDGLFLLHTIGCLRSVRSSDAWIAHYIFPNSMLPSARQITAAIEGRFVLEDWHNFGPDYDATLLSWYANFEASWPELSRRYDERFHRMWRYYLLACAGTFRARRNQLWQVVLSPRGAAGGYRAVR